MTMQHKNIKGDPVKTVDGSTYAEHMQRIERQHVIERFDVRWSRINRNHLYAAAVRTVDDSPWITLAVTVRREIAVENLLAEAGVEVLVPMRMTGERKRRYRLVPPRPIPVMAGYVLVRCRRNYSAYMGLMNVEHVHGIVGGYDRPLLSPAEDVRLFNELALSGAFDHGAWLRKLEPGMKIEIEHGPLSGFKGIVVSLDDTDACIEIDLLGRDDADLIASCNAQAFVTTNCPLDDHVLSGLKL